MIIKGSNFNVIDNTGARLVQCIQYLGTKGHSQLKIGNIMVVAIKSMEKVGPTVKLKVKKSDVCYAIIVKTRQPVLRVTGMVIKANINGVMLLSKTKEPIGTRINGLIYEEVARLSMLRDMVLSKDII